MLLWSAARPGNSAELVAISASFYAAGCDPRLYRTVGPLAFDELPTCLIIGAVGNFSSIFEGLDGLLLLYSLNRFGTNLLILDFRSRPASAERLDKVNRHHHLLA